ncbi:PLD nuclease N-terminal domain-containing protein [Clostridium estertheticum]|uniref:PLD nuclease N-terminal domain-containing protein n=1 Tax=Clostridium estertheticum TaxID=238834 RepID=UPI001CF10A23|nr:PLD nuclease N-terminal domain-containing protein [Clostridium estertheticum]MCB2358993.1 PLD nuclease N-terminal domain-containing protein [Clostridium estertheticum]
MEFNNNRTFKNPSSTYRHPIGPYGFCLLKLSKDNVKYFPKWLWALIIIFGELLGPIAYLLLGRERS